MNNMNNFFHFNPTYEVFLVFIAGIVCICLSVLLIVIRNKPCEKTGHFIIRDLLQVFGLGFILPLWFVIFYKHQSVNAIGLTLSHWPYAILANIVLAVSLALIFLKEHRGKKLHFHTGDITYLLVTGIFEVIFFYGFLRYYFEQAFGIVPAIILACISYSFHHIGFEVQMRGNTLTKEFSKLFFVGIMYATIFRVFNSVLAIYPHRCSVKLSAMS